jgi:glycogen synthase
MSKLQVLAVTSEFFPLIKTGGLADVAGALPGALAQEDVVVTTLLPGYPAVLAALPSAEPVQTITDLFGGPATLLAARVDGARILAIDAPHLFGRPGNPYVDASGVDWPDNAQRFAGLSRVGAELARGLLPGWQPDVVHAHDWQAGLVPAYLRFTEGPSAPVVLTIHNIAFGGRFPAAVLPSLGLPWSSYTLDGVEFWGGIGTLKAGVRLADRVTTVSPTYAREICTQEGGFGCPRHPQRHRYRGVESGQGPGAAANLHAQEPGPAGSQQGGALRAIRLEAGCPALRRGQPPDDAEGAGPAAGEPADAQPPRGLPCDPGCRAAGAGTGHHGRGAARRDWIVPRL